MPKIAGLFDVSCFSTPAKQLFGLEVELESYVGLQRDISGWSAHPDGSLRNSGVEFISTPMGLSTVVDGFKQLHASFLKSDKYDKFSERTSIHVHTNCQNFLEEEVVSIVHWYAVMEEEFFKKVDPSRRHNIHCVPLADTFLNSYYRSSLSTMAARWSKYTALNLIPLRKLGTLEFRHMEGHDDPDRLTDWLQTIANLMEYGRAVPFSANSLTVVELRKGYEYIFRRPFNRVEFFRDNFNGIVDLKLAFKG